MTLNSSLLPLISVVVPSFNQGNFIEQTITSILGQQYSRFELIIIDGGSTDQTLDIIKNYEDKISFYVSEPDKGQANAINKGFQIATGDILAWLNSDDMYLPCTFTRIAALIGLTNEPKLVYGSCLLMSENEGVTLSRIPPLFDGSRLTYFDYIDQPSTFWSRCLWELAGPLNEGLKYTLDWDWFIRASKIGDMAPCKDFLSIYRLHPGHKTGSGGLERMEEILRIVETYADDSLISAYWDVYTLVKSHQLKPKSPSLWHRFLRKWLCLKHSGEKIYPALTMLN